PGHMGWMAALQFGFIELDCALLHGSSAAVDDSLGPDSSPLLLLDRLTRMDVNLLFTARSGQQFRLELSDGGIESQVRDLEGQRQHQQSVPQRQVIGIGAGVRYTLYDPGSDRVDFLVAGSRPQQRARGFA
ncbi:MAG: phosphoesterase, partial [Cyanobacteria bacterium K_DeepCast_35m_m2_155]|nr:phosphoesterase [Cyanobacteria bacterium K_DeepCast_35m_m2_155]